MSGGSAFRKGDRLARIVVFVFGLLFVVAGGAALSRGAGVWDAIAGAGEGDRSAQAVVTADVSAAFGRHSNLIWPLVAVGALLLALLGFLVLRAELRVRVSKTRQVDLTDDERAGVTRVSSSVVTAAFVDDLTDVPGVEDASASLRGDPQRPLVDVRLDVADDADVEQVLSGVEGGPLRHLRESFEIEPESVAVELSLVEPRERHLG